MRRFFIHSRAHYMRRALICVSGALIPNAVGGNIHAPLFAVCAVAVIVFGISVAVEYIFVRLP